MKRIKLSILLLISIFLIGCGQSNDHVKPKEPQNNSMFVVVENNLWKSCYMVVYHKDTKVMYTKSQHGVFTLLVDADGKPMTWKGE